MDLPADCPVERFAGLIQPVEPLGRECVLGRRIKDIVFHEAAALTPVKETTRTGK